MNKFVLSFLAVQFFILQPYSYISLLHNRVVKASPQRINIHLDFGKRASRTACNNLKTTSEDTVGILEKIQSLMLSVFSPFSKKGEIATPPKPIKAQDAVLVLGATGKTGSKVVQRLLTENKRNIVVVGRNESKLSELFSTYSLNKNLIIRSGSFDIRNFGSGLQSGSDEFFEGVSQVVSCLGPVFSSSPEASSSSEDIDYKATVELINKFAASKKDSTPFEDVEQPLVQFSAGKRNLSQWNRLDDVIMGGRSSSGWSEISWNGEGESFCRWSGGLITQGGGFCGTVVKSIAFDTEGFDGISLLVRGDGNRYKFRLKPADQGSSRNEFQYQAAFNTDPAGAWRRIHLPFESFFSVKRNDVDYAAPKVNKGAAGGKMQSLGLVFSRFDFNELPNSKCVPGAFQLDVAEIGLYRSVRPAVVLVSSAGTERVNRLTTAEERARDVPIVQLNPQGILNWKFKGETALRLSGLPYSIIRATGLVSAPAVPDSTDIFSTPRRLQAAQGDTLAGRITRDELAGLISASLDSPHAAGKTFEVRRDESDSGKLPSAEGKNNWGEQNFDSLFRELVPDSDRTLADIWRCLPPFPFANDPPAPPPPERVQEILNDPRVIAQQARAEN